MFGWILKYKPPGSTQPGRKTATAAPTAAVAPKLPVAPKPPKAPAPPAAPAVDWTPRLQAAQGDDAALLALALDASPLQTKLAAVAAMVSEDTLKQAEREFRGHDRRVHTLAKQRAQAARAQREARAEALRLIEAARALSAEPQIPVNSAVELDRAWATLDAKLLEPAQCAEFAALTAQLSTLTRDRAEREAALKRWQTSRRQALEGLHVACSEAAAGTQPREALQAALARAQDLAAAAPVDVSSDAALADSLSGAKALAERLVLLDAVLNGTSAPHVQETAPEAAEVGAAPAAPETPETPAEAAPLAAPEPAPQAAAESGPEAAVDPTPEPTPENSPEASDVFADEAVASPAPDAPTAPVAAKRPPPAPRPAQLWKQLPPLADARLDAMLQARFEVWQQAQDAARQHKQAQRREQTKEQQRAVRSERIGALEAVLAQAEATLAEGSVAETHKHLIEIDELLHGGAAADALRARIDRLQDGYAELRGWQHWAGGRARDDLTLEAEALAAACAPGPEGQAPKLQIKQHSEHIDDLRARWKELDRLGGASSRALWQRFDAALKTAWLPVAAHKATLGAAREQNLLQRQQLLQALEATPAPVADEAGGAADLRPAISALDHFRTEWRKLGPLEHTVPHKARDRLVERMNAALQRVEAPLDEARRRAQAERESLIERARALAASAQANPGARDLVGEVRNLQAEWQQRAKALPLPRNAENAMWTQFRAALDAVFSAREAVFSARDAEFKAHAAERVALIERLEALGEASPAEYKRTLAEVENAWQRCGPAPRNEAAALDERFRRAHQTARQWLAGSRQRSWQAACDTLVAKLALCEALEGGGPGATASAPLAQDWDALPALPEAWEAVLRQRAGLAGGTAAEPPAGMATDELLLQLEAAWGLASPAACAQARRELQLQAMKAALETRRPGQTAPAQATPEQWLMQALRRPALQADQRQRLEAVIAALRERGPSGPA